jgi:hypothetical protein
LRIGEVTASFTHATHAQAHFGVSRALALVKGILNQLSERAEAAVDRSRLAALPVRYLDDVGMTIDERASIVGCEAPARDPWTLIAIHRL